MRNIFVYSLIFCSLSASAQSSLLDKYRNMALDYNHDLKAAEKSIAVSMELEKMARADMKPHLMGGANFQYTGNPMELTADIPAVGAISFQGKEMKYGASLSLLQPLYMGGKLLESVKMAQHQQALTTSQAQMVRSAVCLQTDVQYWNTAARAEMVNIATDFRNSMRSLVEVIGQRVEAGLVDPQDLLMAEVKLNEAEYQLQLAENSFVTGRMALNSMIGVALESATQVDADIPVFQASDSLQLVSNIRPEIKMAQSRIRIEESSLKLKDAAYKPQLYLGIDGTYSSPGYNFRSDLDPNYAVYAKLSVPIFEWGKRRSQKQASLRQIGIAADGLNRVGDEVNLEVSAARVSLAQSVKGVELTTSSLGKARENERKAMERYNEGKISILEVIEAQTYRQTSQINHTQAKANAQICYSQLIKALNSYDIQ